MAGVDDKITNGLLIWGNASAAASDLAVLTIAENGTTPGTKPGKDIYADVLNSGIRAGTILSYSLIEALKKGPSSDLSETASEYTSAWYEELEPVSFDYKTQDVSLGDFSDGLNSVLNAYLKNAQTYFSLRANVWNHARNFTVKDADESHSGESVSVDGSQNYVLKLPSAIKADLIGSADDVDKTIKGVNIGDIFVGDGQAGITSKVKSAAEADRAYVDKQNTLASGTYPLVLSNNGASSVKDLKQRSGVQYNESAKSLEAPAVKAPLIYGNYGVCSTVANVNSKEVTIEGFVLRLGASIHVKFTYGNAADNSTPTLNVSGTGAKTIKISDSIAYLNPDSSWRAGDVVEFVYDGTDWVMCKTIPQSCYFGICQTPEQTVAKAVRIPGFILEEGAKITVAFENANTAPLATLNVNSTGAKPIIINGGGTSADANSPRSWQSAEICDFVYIANIWRMLKPNVVDRAANADNATTADNANHAASATSATTAQKLGTSSIGNADERGMYLNQGQPLAGRYRSVREGATRAYHVISTEEVSSLSFSRISLSSGECYFAARCWQTSPSMYRIDADLNMEYSPSRDEWIRISLYDIVKAFFANGSSADFSYFGSQLYWSCTANLKRNNLNFEGSYLVTNMRKITSTEGYAYIGCDASPQDSAGICAHISFNFYKN